MDLARLEVAIDGSKARDGGRQVEAATDRMTRSATKADTAMRRLNRTTRDGSGFTRTRRELEATSQALGRTTQTVTALTSRTGGLRGFFGVLLSLEGARRGIRSIAEFESGLLGVSKTTGIAGAELAGLSEDIRNLSLSLPVASTELLEIAQTAGQLGVQGSDNILRFTETVGKLTLTTDLTAANAASSLARLLNITGENITEVDALGNVVVRLGNEFAATESEIVDTALRVAQATATFGVSSKEAAALGTALAALQVPPELARGTFVRTFGEINSAVASGGDRLERFGQIAGITGQQFADAFREDSLGALVVFLEGLGNLAGPEQIAAALDGVGLTGQRLTPVLQILSSRSGQLRRALNATNDELEVQNANTAEAAIKAGALSSRWTILGNAASNLVNEAGERGFLGILKGIVDVSAEAVNSIAGVAEASRSASEPTRVLGDSLAFIAESLTLAFGARSLGNIGRGVGLLGGLGRLAFSPAGAFGLGFSAYLAGIDSNRRALEVREPPTDFSQALDQVSRARVAAAQAGDDPVKLLEANRSIARSLEEFTKKIEPSGRAIVFEGELGKALGGGANDLIQGINQSLRQGFFAAVDAGDVATANRIGGRLVTSQVSRPGDPANLFGPEPFIPEFATFDRAQTAEGRQAIEDFGRALSFTIEELSKAVAESSKRLRDEIQETEEANALKRFVVEAERGEFAQVLDLRNQALLERTRDPIERTRIGLRLRRDDNVDQLRADGVGEDDVNRFIRESSAEERNLLEALRETQEIERTIQSMEELKAVGEDAFFSVAGAISEAVLSGQSLEETLDNLLDSLTRLALNFAFQQFAGSIFRGGGTGSALDSVPAGSTITPQGVKPATIAGSGGGTVINQSISVSFQGGPAQNRAGMRQSVRQITEDAYEAARSAG